jgi:hypothetical protein
MQTLLDGRCASLEFRGLAGRGTVAGPHRA